MKELQFFKKVFSYYFTLTFIATLFLVVFCQFEFEILFNFIENCLFAILILTPSYYILNTRIRCFYDLLVFTVFSLTVLLESIYYLLFQVFFSASSLFVMLDSNIGEANEFINFYLGFKELFFIISFVAFALYFFNKLKRLNRKLKPITVQSGLVYGLSIFALVVYLKISKQIVYNFPYLFTKSVVEYYQTSKSFDDYSTNNIGFFSNVNTQNENDNSVFVLVLGESTTRSHMQLYGYGRSTNPLLSDMSNELLVYNDVISPHVLTIESITKMLTLSNYELGYNQTSGSIIQLANAAGYDTFWLSNQRPIGIFESLITKIALSAKQTKFLSTAHGQHNRTLDQVLIPELNEVLKTETSDPKFIILHLMGTHFKYVNRFPDSLNTAFKTPRTNDDVNNRQMIKDQYDRAVLNNDYVISEVINSVKKYAKHSAVLYVSDHGEELDNLKRLGHNEDFATKSMYDIPLFLWRSSEHKKTNPLFFDAYRPYMTDDLFHSLAELLKINASQVDSSRSIFSKYFQMRKRVILKTQDYDVKFKKQSSEISLKDETP